MLSRNLSAVVGVVAVYGCARTTHPAASHEMTPEPPTSRSWTNVAPRNGLEVVGWMRRTHPSRELRSLRFTLTTEYRTQPPRATQAVVYAQLPGKVRVEQLPASSRTGEMRDRHRLAVFRSGRRVSTRRAVDLRTLLAFDVFAQNADTTVMWLDSARVRFALARRDALDGRRVWVVGAEPEDTASDQFWVDAEQWRVVRVIQRDPGNPDERIDVRYTSFTDLLDVPVPTRIEVWRRGVLAEVQTLSDFAINPALPSGAFDLSRWRTVGN